MESLINEDWNQWKVVAPLSQSVIRDMPEFYCELKKEMLS